ncbi:MAG: hypothetical protein AAF514_23535 [Verrucomicrobiota bacterium]
MKPAVALIVLFALLGCDRRTLSDEERARNKLFEEVRKRLVLLPKTDRQSPFINGKLSDPGAWSFEMTLDSVCVFCPAKGTSVGCIAMIPVPLKPTVDFMGWRMQGGETIEEFEWKVKNLKAKRLWRIYDSNYQPDFLDSG